MKYNKGEVYHWFEDYNPDNHQTYNTFIKILSVRERRIGYHETGLAYLICACKINGSQIGKATCEWTEKEINNRYNILPIKEWKKTEIKRKKEKIKKLKLKIKKLEKEIKE